MNRREFVQAMAATGTALCISTTAEVLMPAGVLRPWPHVGPKGVTVFSRDTVTFFIDCEGKMWAQAFELMPASISHATRA